MTSSSSSLERWLVYAAVGLLLGAALAGMIEPLGSMFRHVPKDYNEGWNAYWSDIAWQGGKLYPPTDSAAANNYPPVSFYAVGLLGKLVGDSIFAGRSVAALSLLAIAINVFFWLGSTGASRGVALFGAALLLAAFVRYAPLYIAVDDPQLLAHAIVLTGLTLLWRQDCSTSALVCASLLMILGGLTKHLLVPLPLAATAWIALYRKEKLLIWIASSVIGSVMALLALRMVYGMDFFGNLFASRGYSTHLMSNAYRRLSSDLRPVLLASLAAIAVVAGRTTTQRLTQGAAFALIYLALAAVVGALASGGAGVDRNAYFDVVIAACLCIGVTLSYCLACQHGGSPAVGTVASMAALAMGMMFAFHAVVRWPSEWQELRETPAREAAAWADIDAIRSVGRGHAACETLALCYWAKNPLTVDFYNFGQKLAIDALPPSACERVFGNAIDLVQIDRPQSGSIVGRLPPYCAALIMSRFVLARESSYGTLRLRK